MLKRFFISMLGTMAGLWISIALLVVAGTMIVAAALGKSAAETTVKVGKESVLVLDLSGVVQERYQPSSFIDFIQQGELGSPTLEEMLQAVRTAAGDDKIEGIYIKCGGASMGYASREELLEALLDLPGCGLSHTSGNPHQRLLHPLPVKRADGLKRLFRILHTNPWMYIVHIIVLTGQYRRRSRCKRTINKAVGVCLLTNQRHKQILPFHHTGINADM